MATQTKFLKLTIADNSEDIRPITNSNMLKIEKSYGGMSNQIGNLTNVVSQNNLVNVLRDTCIRFIEQDGEYWVQEYKWDNLKQEWVESIKTQNYFADAENFNGYYFKESWTGIESADPPFNMNWNIDDILVINQTTTATGYGIDYRQFPQVLGGYYQPELDLVESPKITWQSVPSIHKQNTIQTPLPLFITNGRVQAVKIERVTDKASPDVGWTWTYTINKSQVPELPDLLDSSAIPVKLRIIEASGTNAVDSNEVFIKQTWVTTTDGYEVTVDSDVPYTNELYAYFEFYNPTLLESSQMPRISLTKAVLLEPLPSSSGSEAYPLTQSIDNSKMRISLRVDEGLIEPGDSVLISHARRGNNITSGFRNIYRHTINSDEIIIAENGVQYIVFTLEFDRALLTKMHYTYSKDGINIKFFRIRRESNLKTGLYHFSNAAPFKWKGTYDISIEPIKFGLPRIQII